ncbi:hypothetical protein [Paraburkholderia sp. BR14374]|uniref:hypothetical protein n=1 Tax=Paraburkholderia sp. BR14374 TaxID=3237007 RepID=UPI0034CEDE5F
MTEARFRFLTALNKAYTAALSFYPLNQHESRLHSFRRRNIPHAQWCVAVKRRQKTKSHDSHFANSGSMNNAPEVRAPARRIA